MLRREIIVQAKKRRQKLLKQFNSLCKKIPGYTKTEFALLHSVTKERIGQLLFKAIQENESGLTFAEIGSKNDPH